MVPTSHTTDCRYFPSQAASALEYMSLEGPLDRALGWPPWPERRLRAVPRAPWAGTNCLVPLGGMGAAGVAVVAGSSLLLLRHRLAYMKYQVRRKMCI